MKNKKPINIVIYKFLTPLWAAILTIPALLFIGLIYFDFDNIALPVLISSGSLLLSVRLFWPLRYSNWYLVTMSLVSVAHLAAIALLPWPDDSTYDVRVAPIMALDVASIVVIVILLNKIFGREKA